MAQLKDLIVNGASNFIGTTTFNRTVAFNDDITFSSSSTLNLLNVTAAEGAEYKNPALVIGTSSGTHLEIDNTGIMAKSNKTTSTTLYLNKDGGAVSFPSGLVQIGANADEAQTLINNTSVQSTKYIIANTSNIEKAHFEYNTNDDSVDLIFI